MSSITCPHCRAANPLPGGADSVRCGRCQQTIPVAALQGIQARPTAPAPTKAGMGSLAAKPRSLTPWLVVLAAGGAVAGLFLLMCLGVGAWVFLRKSAAPAVPVAVAPPAWPQPADPPVVPIVEPELVPIIRPDAPPPPGNEATFPTPLTPGLVPIRMPALSGDRVVVALPSAAKAVTVGGGGRWLIFHLPAQQQLAVFDVNEAKVVKTLPAASAQVLIAAGMDTLMVVVPETRTVERWNLFSFQKEAEGTFAIKVPVIAATMGAASRGPLLIQGVNWPTLGECLFINVDTLQRLPMAVDPHRFFDTEPKLVCRAAANGRAFANFSYSGLQTCVLRDNQLRLHRGQAGDAPVPGPDGQVLYTARGRFTLDLQPLPGPRAPCWPAHAGPYYLTPAGAGVAIRKGDQPQPLATVGDVDSIKQPSDAAARQNWSLDKRIHFIPQARLLVTIPPTNDRLVLRRVSWKE